MEEMRNIKHSANVQPVSTEKHPENVKQPAEQCQSQETMLIISHDACLGGATINILRLARFLRENYGFCLHFLIYQGGPKLDDFQELGTAHLLDINYTYRNSLPEHVEQIVADLAQSGVRRVIANTVISGSLTKLLKQYGMTVISLVHEMPQLIQEMNLLSNAQQLAEYSDAVIFGGSAVRKAFPFSEKLSSEKTFVLGQGSYYYSTPFSREESRARLRKQLGIPSDAHIILGCGQADTRKGVDLFANVLTRLVSDIRNVYFVWLGNIADQTYIAEIQQTLRSKQLDNRFIILDKFENDPSLYFCGADIFFLSSREDPFPTVVLEAMRAHLPAAAFSGTGGAEEMLAESRGIIARHLNAEDMAKKLKDFFLQPDPDMTQRAYAYASDFTYERYASRILTIFRTIENPMIGLHSNAAVPYLIKVPTPAANAKRILHIIGNFHMGGSSKLIADIIESLGMGFQHHIITGSNPSPYAYIGASVEELPLDTPDCVFKDRFDAYMPDCIHIHYWGAPDIPWYSRVFKNLAHMTVPVIQNVNTPVAPFESPVVTKNVFVSCYTEKEFGKNNEKNVVIHPGIDLEHYFRHTDMSLRDPDCVGMVYRLDGDKITLKSFDPLITLAKTRPSINILIVGGGALLEQIKTKITAAGVSDRFQFTGHVPFEDLPRYYSQMSVFLAPVAAESFGQVVPIAMAMQLPVAAYDTGALGEILAEPSSLVPFGHSDLFAKKVCELLDNPLRREESGKQHKERVIRLFSLQSMVSAYQQLYNDVIAEYKDAAYLAGQGKLDSDFSGPLSEVLSIDMARIYLKRWKSIAEARKPYPGFHPGIYAEDNSLTAATDPYVHYLKHNSPEGRWNYPVLFISNPCPKALYPTQMAALHIHAYYPELLQEILDAVRYNATVPDFFISVDSSEKQEAVQRIFAKNALQAKKIVIVPNRGRDLGPFLTAFGQTFVKDYAFVGHVHTKKSLDINDPDFMESWRKFIIENTLGGKRSGAMMDTILTNMETRKDLGIVFPDDPNIVGWTKNFAIAEELAKKLPDMRLPKHFNFPVGSFFWIRTDVLKPLVECGFTWNDYPEEPLPYDGTILHALERILGLLPAYTGYTSLSTHVNGVTREVTRFGSQDVFVTVTAKNYIAQTRVLYNSIRRFYPDVNFYVLLADNVDGYFRPEDEPFPFIFLEDLNLPDLERMTGSYNTIEFTCSMKPYAMLYLLDKYPFRNIIYVDADLYFISRLEEAEQLLAEGTDAIVTPHITRPAENDRQIPDLSYLKHGIYNLGFLALRNSEDSKAFLRWWARRLRNECLMDPSNGLYADQKWADLLPVFIEKTKILRHPGYNVAYWNIPQRTVTYENGAWLSNGLPLRFLHLSGSNLDDPDCISRHNPSLKVSQAGDLGCLLADYRKQVFKQGFEFYRKLPYAFKSSNSAPSPKRLFFADDRIPDASHSAGELTSVGILRDLCKLGYEVVFAPLDLASDSSSTQILRDFGVEVVTSDSGYSSVADYLNKHGHSFSVFYLCRIHVANVIMPIARKLSPEAKVIFHAPDLSYFREMRQAEIKKNEQMMRQALHTREFELNIMRQADTVVIISPVEYELLQSELPPEKMVLFQALYAPVTAEPSSYNARKDIFFLGGFKHMPNVDAMEWFIGKVWPIIHDKLPEAVFHIVGADVPPEIQKFSSIPGVNVAGYVKDLEPLLSSMRVGVAPLRFGAGIKGKVAMTMGAGIPCVCTDIAAEGMHMHHEEHTLIANNAEDFAAKVILLYENKELWNKLSEKGLKHISDHFGAEVNTKTLIQVLRKTEESANPIQNFLLSAQAKRLLCRDQSEKNPSILLIFHELFLTGAPIVGVQLAQTLAKHYEVAPVILALRGGPLKDVLEREGMTVIIHENQPDPFCEELFCRHFDAIIVNSLASSVLLQNFDPNGLPMAWWIHESAEGFRYAPPVLPRCFDMMQNVWLGSPNSEPYVRQYIAEKKTAHLIYGVEDRAVTQKRISPDSRKIVFGIIGSLIPRKGQNILLSAITQLSPSVLKKIRIIMVGEPYEPDMWPDYTKDLLKKLQNFPNIEYHRTLSNNDYLKLLASLDALICPSTDDPMPVVVTEALMCSKLCIISDAIGQASFLSNEEAMVIPAGSPEALAKAITKIAEQPELITCFAAPARAAYERLFSLEQFENNAICLIDKLLNP
ncbi:MAG: glycosyltransferase [Endomicrobia bacterium]|nr:glycosyltransferase [Endomicrobiia bacterium]